MVDNYSPPPLIGLPARMDPGKDSQYLSRTYVDAILAAGGVPIIIPLAETPESFRALAEGLDGVLLTGSRSDVDPAHYAAASEARWPVQPLRDKTDFMLLGVAMKRRIPVLAVCFGLQSLNVFAGGSLIQDIPNRAGAPVRHSNPRSNGRPSHAIRIVPGSILEELAGGTNSEVNSTHHQAVDTVGQGLEVVARAPDGIIEALIGRDPSHWILGVQWHPEKSFAYDDFSRRIFERFITNCAARRETHERSHSQTAERNRRESQS